MIVLLLASAGLAAVAAAGVLYPLRRGRAMALERLSDPLEDERQSLLRALRDLDQERATGLLSELDYRALRTETERRAVTVLRALEARDGAGRLAGELGELRTAPTAEGNGSTAHSPSRRGVVSALAVGAAIIAVAVPLLASAVSGRSPDQPVSGEAVAPQGPLQFFESRVGRFPNDVAARLDLANAYFQVGDLRDSVEQYLAALDLDPQNVEARSTLGFLLYKAGHAEEGLQAVDRALAIDPANPEALYFKGVILLKGLHRSRDAAEAFRDYLDAAPFGSRRAEVQELLAQAEGRSAG